MNTAPSSPLNCPICGLTAAELRDSGRMGCAECYRVFAAMVVQAVAVLHNVAVELPPSQNDAPSPNPWPTRRAETIPPRR